MENLSNYNEAHSYLVLHIYRTSAPPLTPKSNDISLLYAAFYSASDALTPRGLRTPVALEAPIQGEQTVSHDTYVWNGKNCLPLISSFALAKAYVLENALHPSLLEELLTHSPSFPFISQLDECPGEKIDDDLSFQNTHHLLKRLHSFSLEKRVILGPRSSDFGQLFELQGQLQTPNCKVKKEKKIVKEKEKNKENDKKSDSEKNKKERTKKNPSTKKDRHEKKDRSSKKKEVPSSARGMNLSLNIGTVNKGGGSSGGGGGNISKAKTPNPKAGKLSLGIKGLVPAKEPVKDVKFVPSASVQGHVVIETGTERKQQIPEDTRDRVRYFNQICSKVTDQLYLGSDVVARDSALLEENKITHILNCAGTVCNDYFPDKFIYKTLHLLDGRQEDVRAVFLEVMDFIDEVVQTNGHIFIHCQQGISRSSTMLICYLIWKWKQPAQIIGETVKQARNISSPNAGFIVQLIEFGQLVSQPLEKRPPQLYVVVPHNLCAPDVFPLSLVKSEVRMLDLRNVYVLATPTTLFLWVGPNAHPACVEKARWYLDRLVKFMHYPANFIELTSDAFNSDFYSAIGHSGSEAPKIEGNEMYDLPLSLLSLYNLHDVPFEEKNEEPFEEYPEHPHVAVFRCTWSRIHPKKEDLERLKTPDSIFAILTFDGKHCLHLWVGKHFSSFPKQEINNLGLQFLTRNKIFMTTSDYQISISHQGQEPEELQTLLENSFK